MVQTFIFPTPQFLGIKTVNFLIAAKQAHQLWKRMAMMFKFSKIISTKRDNKYLGNVVSLDVFLITWHRTYILKSITEQSTLFFLTIFAKNPSFTSSWILKHNWKFLGWSVKFYNLIWCEANTRIESRVNITQLAEYTSFRKDKFALVQFKNNFQEKQRFQFSGLISEWDSF